jgi:hypothetical protein
MLVRYQDRVFLQEGKYWFLWDTALSIFRPIDGFGWDGTHWVADDRAYCKDPLVKTYCFGSKEMGAYCVELTKKYADRIETAPIASYISIGNPTWFRDRPVNFTHAASRDVTSWKKMVNGRARTCKRRSSNKFTKRTI